MKSWRWFQARIQGLLAADTRLSRHFQPAPDQPKQQEVIDDVG